MAANYRQTDDQTHDFNEKHSNSRPVQIVMAHISACGIIGTSALKKLSLVSE